MLAIVQTILTYYTAARNKSIVFMPNQVLKFLSHDILDRPTPLVPSAVVWTAISKISVHFS